MALALRSPSMIKDIVSVDNAPVDAILSTDFVKYVRGMKKVEDANVTSQKEADQIFAEFEEVGFYCSLLSLSPPPLQKSLPIQVSPSHYFGTATSEN